MSFDTQRFEVGRAAARTRIFSSDEVRDHSRLTGDAAVEPGCVPVGMIGGMISELLGTRLPGRGTNWLKQKLRFEDAARIGEPITTEVKITRVRPDKALINLESVCTGREGRVIARGESLVLVRELE